MKIKVHAFTGILTAAMLTNLAAVNCLADEPYQLLNQVPIGLPAGGESLALTEGTPRRLYVVHGSKIGAVDVYAGEKVVGEFANPFNVESFVLAPHLQRGFACSLDSGIMIIDLAKLRSLGAVNAGKKAGLVLFQPSRGELYSFDPENQSASVFEADDADFLTDIKLPGKVKTAVADPKNGLIYCLVDGKNSVMVIDSKTHKLTDEWPIGPGEGPSTIAVDNTRQRLFIGCANKMIVPMKSAGGKVGPPLTLAQPADALAFDPVTRFLFVIGQGTVDIWHEDSPEKFSAVQTLKSAQPIRALALDAVSHKIYVAAADAAVGVNVLVYGIPKTMAKP